MTPAGFAVIATRRFERDYRSLLRHHAELPERYAVVLGVLLHDPYNRTRRYQIRSSKESRRATASTASVTVASVSATTSKAPTCF